MRLCPEKYQCPRSISARTFLLLFIKFYPVKLIYKIGGLTVNSAHAGLNPLFIAFPADFIFDHAQQ